MTNYPDDLDYEDYDETETPLQHIIHIFGVDTQNQSVSVKVTGFKPRFYVNILTFSRLQNRYFYQYY